MPVSIDCAFLDVKLDSSISTNARLYHQRCKLFTWASPMVPLLKCVAFMFAKRICLNTFSISRILNYWNIFNINYFKWALTETIYGSYMAYWLHDRALTWIYGWTVSTKQGFLEEFLSPCSDSHDIIVLVFNTGPPEDTKITGIIYWSSTSPYAQRFLQILRNLWWYYVK